MALQGEVNGVIPNIRNVLIALDTQMTLKMGNEVWNGSKHGIAISAWKRSGTNSVAIATPKYAICGVFLRVQYWCQVSITLL